MDSQAFLIWLSDYYRNDITSLRLILRLMGMQQPGGLVHATQARLAVDLGVQQSQISRCLAGTTELGVTAKVKRGCYQLHPILSLRGGRVPIEPRPGTRARGHLQVDQLSILDAIEDNEHLPDAFRALASLPDPKQKPLREDKLRARARAAAKAEKNPEEAS
ncbi:hypothetical protein ACN20G_37200 (plasmid) [Streptomyces sp. BI20]|uniref:hypothetical protein n=1 Tax=Streptomyces sp. BI20 TaxID=3403460 RepID=UPI003C75F207